MKKVLFVGNVGLVINSFIKGYIIELAKLYDVYLLYNQNSEPRDLNFPDNVHLVHYDIQRKFNFSDLYFFFKLFKFMKKNRIDVTISITPKVGFVTNLAAFMAGVSIRIHFFTGQIWINLKGFKRSVLKILDKFLFSLTTHRLVDSPTQLSFLMEEGFLIDQNTHTVAYGSICGVDIKRFFRNDVSRNSVRHRMGITDKVVLLYIGRLDLEKGIVNLLDAFEMLNRTDVRLLLVGPDEMKINETLKKYKSADRILYEGMTGRPEDYYSAGDIFCYISHREGFGLSVIEASASELPVIGTDIVGLRDAISNKETGFLVDSQNQDQLINSINLLVDNSDLRFVMGKRGRKLASERFDKDFVQGKYIALIKKIIS
jgi:glycosyltransferase involved in cell wall biosynthesis